MNIDHMARINTYRLLGGFHNVFGVAPSHLKRNLIESCALIESMLMDGRLRNSRWAVEDHSELCPLTGQHGQNEDE